MESETGRQLFVRLRAVREALGLSQNKFSEQLGLGYKYYQLLEQGRKADPKLSTIEKLAGALGVETWELLNPEVPIGVLAEAQAKYGGRRTRRRKK